MSPAGWAAEPQRVWLEERNDGAVEARRRGSYTNWLTATYHDWFLLWSERERLFGPDPGQLTPEQETELAAATRHKQAQLKNWFHNNRNKRFLPRSQRVPHAPSHVLAAPSRGPAGPSRDAIRAELATGKASRAPQAREVYCRMYYDEEKKAVVTRELAAEREALGRALTKAETMATSRRLIDGFFEEAPEETKEVIHSRVAVVKAARNATPPPYDPSHPRTPEEYQNAIDAAPKTISKLLTTVHEDSGWCFTVVGAGPSPRDGGAIKSFAVHFGTNPSGHMLDEAISDYRAKYVHPMVHFAKGVYPRDVRELRALPASVYEEADEMMMLIPRATPAASSTAVTRASSVSAAADDAHASASGSGSAVAAGLKQVPHSLPLGDVDASQAAASTSWSANSMTTTPQDPATFNFPVAADLRFNGAPSLPTPWDLPMGEVGGGSNLYDTDGIAAGMGSIWDASGFNEVTNATHSVPIPPISGFDPLLDGGPLAPIPPPIAVPVHAHADTDTPRPVPPLIAVPAHAHLLPIAAPADAHAPAPPPTASFAPAPRRSTRHQPAAVVAPASPSPPALGPTPATPPKRAARGKATTAKAPVATPATAHTEVASTSARPRRETRAPAKPDASPPSRKRPAKDAVVATTEKRARR